MPELPGKGESAGLSDYLAAERTLLPGIRTGLALMGFGFVVARFGLFLEQIQIVERAPSVQPYGKSLWFGTVLIGAGIAVNLAAGWRHIQIVRRMNRGQARTIRPRWPSPQSSSWRWLGWECRFT